MAGKRYIDAKKKIDNLKDYEPEEAVKLVRETATASFDETIEVHARLNIDPRHADQQIRTSIVMPFGLGKTVTILVFAEGEAAQIAREAGADIIGDDEVIAKIQNEGWVDFDVGLATPDMMRKISRLGRVLGRRGLMPNPKAGTLVQPQDIPRAIEEARAGRVEFRNDRTGNIHVPIGKASFTEEALVGNMATLMDVVRRNRPPAVRGAYIRRLVLTSTMGPAVRVDPFAALAMTPPA